MTHSKTKLIINPVADKGYALKQAEELRPLMEEFGGMTWAPTSHPKNAIELARQAGEDGYDLVIAAGGDGTVHEVINGLMQVPAQLRPRLGIIPLGSGNDFAVSIGVSLNPVEAVKRIFTGQPKWVDVGSFSLDGGTAEHFNNTFGMGFDAIVTIRSQKLTHIRGFLMYLVAVLQTIAVNLNSPMMNISTDTESWNENTIMLVVCNGPREGGGFTVAPGSDASDGIFNYASVRKVSRLMMLRLVPEVMKGTHGRFKQVRLGQLHKIHIRSDKPVMIHADGEVISGFDSNVHDISVEVIPSALEVMI